MSIYAKLCCITFEYFHGLSLCFHEKNIDFGKQNDLKQKSPNQPIIGPPLANISVVNSLCGKSGTQADYYKTSRGSSPTTKVSDNIGIGNIYQCILLSPMILLSNETNVFNMTILQNLYEIQTSNWSSVLAFFGKSAESQIGALL